MGIMEAQYNMKTTVFSEGNKTFETRHELEGVEGAANTMIVITERPVLNTDNYTCVDSSWMHIQNHMKELDIGTIRLVNLFATVWHDKPTAKELRYDEENISYIDKLLDDPADGVIIGWGNGLSSNIEVAKIKLAILKMLKEKKVENVYHFIADGLDPDMAEGLHPLFLGLRYGRKQWGLEEYPVDAMIASLERLIKEKTKKKPAPKKKARSKKGKEQEDDGSFQVEVIEDVLESA